MLTYNKTIIFKQVYVRKLYLFLTVFELKLFVSEICHVYIYKLLLLTILHIWLHYRFAFYVATVQFIAGILQHRLAVLLTKEFIEPVFSTSS